eukprot:scaffold19484_cov67-Phaeocystis_antarctica.AAC.3
MHSPRSGNRVIPPVDLPVPMLVQVRAPPRVLHKVLVDPTLIEAGECEAALHTKLEHAGPYILPLWYVHEHHPGVERLVLVSKLLRAVFYSHLRGPCKKVHFSSQLVSGCRVPEDTSQVGVRPLRPKTISAIPVKGRTDELFLDGKFLDGDDPATESFDPALVRRLLVSSGFHQIHGSFRFARGSMAELTQHENRFQCRRVLLCRRQDNCIVLVVAAPAGPGRTA